MKMLPSKPQILVWIVVCLMVSSSFAAESDEPVIGDARAVDLAATQRVTVHLKSALPDAAVAAISQQCGAGRGGMQMKFLKFGPTTGPFSPRVGAHDFDLDNEPLVRALLHLCDVYDLNVEKLSGEDLLVFSPRSVQNDAQAIPHARPTPAPAPICLSGPFAVVARSVVRDRQLDPLPDPPPGLPNASPVLSNTSISYNLYLQLVAEPRITVLRWPSQPAIETMVDDKNSVLWDAEHFQIPTSFSDQGPPGSTVPVLFLSPAQGAKTIAKFSGSFQLQVLKRSRRIEWSNLDDGRPRSTVIEGVHVTVNALEDTAGTPTQDAGIDVDGNGMDPVEWQQRMSFIAQGSHITIYDQAGSILSDPFRWYPTGNGLNIQMMVKVKGTGESGKPIGRAYRMVWDFPVEAGEVNVPFSFTDLPLPPQ